uniref:Bifunctional inhibitor/plant lipid transfer protein/seed storage helical domain-containing protein n=1 Tax=Kalanchoe fedtschenkoi TaxID=63787 RepID=A0A7N0V5B3_KALFE
MKNSKATSLANVVGLLFLATNFALVAEAASVVCSPLQLVSCLPSFTSSAPPTPQCCSKLKEQEPCLCSYIKNPAFAKYINNPNAKKVLQVCQVPIPKCG